MLCPVSNGTDTNSNPTYPTSCNATLNFPRFALAAGSRLFIADGGNDRVLVFNTIPTQNGASADLVIGQIGGSVNQASDAADSLRTPMSLAWDGTNLYVSDAYNRRITVYSMGENTDSLYRRAQLGESRYRGARPRHPRPAAFRRATPSISISAAPRPTDSTGNSDHHRRRRLQVHGGRGRHPEHAS